MLTDIAIFILIGVCSGLLAGLLGIGSGVFVVPALAFVFAREHFDAGFIMHFAAGTCLATMIITASSSFLGHCLRHGIPVWPVYRRIFLGVAVGTVLGVLLAGQLHSDVLKIIFGVLVLLLGFKMFFFTASNPKSGSKTLPSTPFCSAVGLLIGAKSGLLGIGGGSISIPFLTHYKVPMRQAIAVSTAIGVTVSIIGAISFAWMGRNEPHIPAWSTGYIYWPAWLGVIIGSLTFVPVGVLLSHKVHPRLLRRVFAVFLLAVGLHMLHVDWWV